MGITPIDQDGFIAAVIIHGPRINGSLVNLFEIPEPCSESPSDDHFGNIMAALTHA
jgi:hypothetical protein